MAPRRARQLDSALSAVLIGRQVGGNLPSVLETTAMSLREMARLEGVVRTKTAEGKMQLWVLRSSRSPCLRAVLRVPGYFDSLTESIAGYAVIILAVMFWFASLVVARKILAVDIYEPPQMQPYEWRAGLRRAGGLLALATTAW